MMMKHFLWIISAGMLLLPAGCAFLSTDDFDPGTLPGEWSVNVSGTYYNSFVSFTGSPASDFAMTPFIDDAEGDVPDATGDIAKVYVAYSPFYLFIGHESPESKQDPDANGAFYVMIDNGLTNGDGAHGVTNVSDEGLTAAGLSGSFGTFDGAGVEVDRTGSFPDARVSFYFKHWRPLGADMKGFGFTIPASPMERYSGASFIGYPGSSSASTAVTEVAIPWDYIFKGYTNTANPPGTVYLWFGTDPTLDRAGSQDTAPDNSNWDLITNWKALQIN